MIHRPRQRPAEIVDDDTIFIAISVSAPGLNQATSPPMAVQNALRMVGRNVAVPARGTALKCLSCTESSL